VPNYDRFGNTVKVVASIVSSTPNRYITRCLDNVPVIGPKDSLMCEKFSESYRSICKECNIVLLDNCAANEKAFENQKIGKVLGIWFDSVSLSWQYPVEKRKKLLLEISKAIQKKKANLEQMQSLMGRLNDFLQMCPFLKSFKSNLNECLSSCYECGHAYLTEDAVVELHIWAGCICDNEDWFPIPHRPSQPPIQCKTFISDAAGLPDGKIFSGGEGVGGVGFNEEGHIIAADQFFWSLEFLSFVDGKGARMGIKTSLEMVGALFHIVLFPHLFENSNVIIQTDSMSCFYGWENKCVKKTKTAFIIIRSISVLCAFLNCELHFQHVPRVSNWEAQLVDRLSRKSTTLLADKKLVDSFKGLRIPKSLLDWLSSPSENWSLPVSLLNDLR
jgi:hypothetical protein